MIPANVKSRIATMIKNQEERLDPYRIQVRISNEFAALVPPVILNDAQLKEVWQEARDLALSEELRGTACRRNVLGGEQ